MTDGNKRQPAKPKRDTCVDPAFCILSDQRQKRHRTYHNSFIRVA